MSNALAPVRSPRRPRARSSVPWLGGSGAAIAAIVSWAEVFVVAFVAALLYAGSYATTHTPVKDALGWDTLKIDGNRAKHAVLFPHADHQKRIGKSRQACMTCHHMSKPMDGPTGCHVCHRDMYLSMSIFDHESHQQALGGNKACSECHPQNKAKENAKPCRECHGSYTKTLSDYAARSFESAMHSRCVGCHRKESKKVGKPAITKCRACHKDIDSRRCLADVLR